MTKAQFRKKFKALPAPVQAGAYDDPEAVVDGMIDRGMVSPLTDDEYFDCVEWAEALAAKLL